MKSGKTRIAGAGMTHVRQKPIPSWQEDDADKTAVTDETHDLTGTRIAPDTIRGVSEGNILHGYAVISLRQKSR